MVQPFVSLRKKMQMDRIRRRHDNSLPFLVLLLILATGTNGRLSLSTCTVVPTTL